MKIAICTNFYHPHIGGGEIVTKTIAEHLAKDHQVGVFTTRLSRRTHNFVNGVKIYSFHPQSYQTFGNQIESFAPDSVLIYSDLFYFFDQLLAQQGSYKKTIALCGANRLYQQPRRIKQFYKCLHTFSWVITHSTIDRDYKLRDDAPPDLRDKFVVVPNGVDLSEFDHNELSRKDIYPDESHKQWILNISNFFPGKGQNHIIDILSLLPEPKNKIYIQVATDIEIPLSKRLEAEWLTKSKKLKTLGINVHFEKNIQRHRIIGLLRNSNVLVLPSEKEVAPLVLIEAMAARCPWVAWSVGNSMELAGGRCVRTAKLPSSGSCYIDDLVKKNFATTLSSVALRPDLGDEGRLDVENRFDWRKILPEYKMRLL